uniref:Uncharacterized protein n=1 Tax=viral metagenome TaxID=1070528 RepID=A0A6C0JLN8_9ZZZZ
MYNLKQDPVFWSFFLTTSTVFIIGIVKIISKSKCKKCVICGVCEIERDIEIEERAEEFELSRNRIEPSNI